MTAIFLSKLKLQALHDDSVIAAHIQESDTSGNSYNWHQSQIEKVSTYVRLQHCGLYTV